MTIQSDLRVPIFAMEFDPSLATDGPSILRYNALLIGQRLSTGIRPQLKVDRVTSPEQGELFYGLGSQLALMIRAWFENNRGTELYCCSLDDAGAGVAASGSYVIGGTATEDGSIAFYIGGKRVAVAVTSGQTGTNVGDALVAAMTDSLPVSGSNSVGTVTMTAKNKGEAGNDIPLLANINSGEELPDGITLSISAMASGANNPSLQDVIDVIGDQWYNIFCAAYVDTTNLTAIENELASRFGPLRMIDGLYCTTKRGNLSQLATFGNSRNSPHVSCPMSYAIPTSGFQMAAAYAAQIAKEGQLDPARPLQTVELVNILAPPDVNDRFSLLENNSLLYDGITTLTFDNTGRTRIQRAITMYQKNALGATDEAYLDVTTMLTLMYMRYDWRNYFSTRYPRAKLADDGVQVGPGQQVMTPKLGKSEGINIFRGWERKGIVENIDQFKNDLVCERDISDRNRLNWYAYPDLMNQLVVGASTLFFKL